MNLPVLFVVAGFLILGIFSQGPVLYDGYKVFRLTPTTDQHVQLLQKLVVTEGVSFWEGPNKIQKSSDVMISPEQQKRVLREIRSSSIDAEELISNVQKLIDDEQVPSSKAFDEDKFFWTKYFPVEDIYQFLDDITEAHSEIASIINIGYSYEGRELKVVKIGKPGMDKKAVWLDGTIHAREWISGAVVTYFINALIRDPKYESWIEDFDFYLLPVANPDGYEFSRIHNRLWRKTRQVYPGAPELEPCVGADPNRNFGFRWMEAGASADPCDPAQTYGGPRAFSENETLHMSEFVTGISEDLAFFGSVHAYSQIILLPYGVDMELPTAEKNEFVRIADLMVERMGLRYGTTYSAGSITDILYPAAGSSMDWAKGTFDTYLTLSFELRDTGRFGFLLPADQIIPTSVEFLEGFEVIIEELRAEFIIGRSSVQKLAPITVTTIVFVALGSYSLSLFF